jgi:glycosyltransferase involved in cell wall biosynthesis
LHLSNGLAESGKVNLRIIAGSNSTDRFKNKKVTVDKNFLHENRSIPTYMNAIKRLVKFIKQNKIDIVHSHSHYAANIAANAAKFTKAKRVQTNHGLLENKGKLKHFTADKFITINEHIYDYFLKNNIAQRKDIEFIRCGIPVLAEFPQKSAGEINVIAASRLVHEKGLDIYINAVAKLEDKYKPNVNFYIAGIGDSEQELKKLNKTKNAGITFLGNVKDMYEMLQKTHIFVYPSRSAQEGFPAVITEAGATGNLVISSDFNGSESIINDKDDGFIFKQGDISSLENILQNAIENYNEYAPMAKKFYNKIKKLYDLDTMIEKHLELYRCLEK